MSYDKTEQILQYILIKHAINFLKSFCFFYFETLFFKLGFKFQIVIKYLFRIRIILLFVLPDYANTSVLMSLLINHDIGLVKHKYLEFLELEAVDSRRRPIECGSGCADNHLAVELDISLHLTAFQSRDDLQALHEFTHRFDDLRGLSCQLHSRREHKSLYLFISHH